MWKVSFLIIIVFACQAAKGQEKRIPANQVDATINEFMKENYPSASGIKYYEDVKNDTTFIESNFRYRSSKYSVMFYKGDLYEEEIYLSFKDIPTSARQAITATLEDHFNKYKILKCQEVNPKTNFLYEITLKGKSGKSTAFWELYFTPSGKLLIKKEVIVQPIPSYF